jgi:hypothetical protein
MTVQDEFATTLRQTQDAWISAAESWTQNLQRFAPQTLVAPFGVGDATAVIDQFFDFTERLLDVNREYAKNLAGAVTAFGGAVRQHVDSVGEVVRGQAQATTDIAKEQVERAEQEEREQARQAKRAEQEQARQAKQAARERYEGWTKAELAEELGNRDLPKTGTVDELRERLVEADTE